MNSNNSDTFLTAAELASLLKVSKRTVDRGAIDGTIPPPMRPTPRVRRWSRQAIEQWIKDGVVFAPAPQHRRQPGRPRKIRIQEA